MTLPEAPVSPEQDAAEQTRMPESTPKTMPKRRHVRPEIIMGIIALAAALLLAVTLLLSRPYLTPREEDPESLLHHQQPQEDDPWSPPEAYLEPTVSETEPENPTIPPDRNPYDRFDFQYDRHNYLKLQNLTSYAGVDVSAFQGKIDWKKVKASGIDFAIIRLGYRGYESGKLVEDEYARANLKGASEAGLRIGAYFFSQALDIRETDQEIQFMLGILGDTKLDMPIVLDWEIPSNTARTRNMDSRTLTDIQRHFCGQMRSQGYEPMIYFNWYQSEHLYVLHELEEYPFWLALYQDRMTYPWKVEMWQYTDQGKVPGIYGNVDLNVYMPD
jgi:GH25 family lysozyme M1 (1,4-beta-N-acetylmuramidase)